MKPINYLLVLMFAMVTFVSCDTYGDYEQEFAPIYPLSRTILRQSAGREQ